MNARWSGLLHLSSIVAALFAAAGIWPQPGAAVGVEGSGDIVALGDVAIGPSTIAAGAPVKVAEAEAAPDRTAADDGSGRIVAIVGSGIDYTHAALGGTGSAADFQANDPDVVEAGSFPTARVIGGFDFAGRYYSAACPAPVPADVHCTRAPAPDPDPLDAPGGRGTQVAGAVLGAAPGVQLVALKVLGDPLASPDVVPAATDLVAAALDWVSDHNAGEDVRGRPPSGMRIDVVLLVPGPNWVSADAAVAEAARRLIATGVTVVVPAGDGGGQPFSAIAPSEPPGSGSVVPNVRGLLSVAATASGNERTWGIRSTWSEGGQERNEDIDAVEGGTWLPQLRDVGPIAAELAWYGQACSDAAGNPAPPAQPVDGKVALIERGTCTFAVKMANAAAAGAVAAVVYSDQRARSQMPCGSPCTVEPGIPGVMIDNGPGREIRQRLEAGTPVSVRLDADYFVPQPWLYHTLAPTSARGPSRGGFGIQPNVAAPGMRVTVPRAGSGNGTLVASGTDFAAATTAGLAARLHARGRDERLDLQRGDVAALIAGSAVADVHHQRRDTGPLAAVAAQGTGRLNPAGSLGATITLSSHNGGPASFSLGIAFIARPGSEPLSWQPTVGRLHNLAAHPRRFVPTFHGAFPAEDARHGIEIGVDPAPLTVPAGATVDVPFRLAIRPSDLRPWKLDRGNIISDTAGLQMAEFDGWVSVREVDATGSPLAAGETVTAPLLVMARAYGCAAAATRSAFRLGNGGRLGTAVIANECIIDGLVAPMPLVGSDPIADERGMPATVDVSAVGIRYGPDRTDRPGGRQIVEWHIRTYTHMLPSDARVMVLVDLDRDGRFDRALTNVHGADARSTLSRGQWFTLNTPLRPGTLEPDFSRQLPSPPLVQFDLDASVTVVRAWADELPLDFDSGDEAFDFAVRVESPREWWSVDPPAFVDDAPDGLVDGETFAVEQARLDCLTLAGTGQPLARSGERGLAVAAGGSLKLEIGYRVDRPACREALDGAEVGVFLSFPKNSAAPSEGQAVIWRGRVGGAATIYLPSTNHRLSP